MSTAQDLDKILKGHPQYAGTFLYDEIVKQMPPQKKFYIVNYITSKETNIMGHYVCLNFTGKDAFYFGAYGIEPDKPRNILGLPNPHTLTKILNTYGGNWKYNKKDYQAEIPGDNDCGEYCTMYIIQPNLNKEPWINRIKKPFMDIAVSLYGSYLK